MEPGKLTEKKEKTEDLRGRKKRNVRITVKGGRVVWKTVEEGKASSTQEDLKDLP